MSLPLQTESKVADLSESHWRHFRRFPLSLVHIVGGVGGVLSIAVNDVCFPLGVMSLDVCVR
ncbi:hypothetical protein DPMN_124598 [Dreissena polymorpha]|uniref:Uncharacterized protein n=1 Tax=Dreissena polymorpha TaxID=45954 RepID=A0A9D4GTU3_DREPO|nr:hypothetical protein DPMN_124598 [Dreissena polymorpha]